MSYESAMEAAGATVVVTKYFGSYQGDAWSLVEFEGKRGWVQYSYGSCSGCDSWEAFCEDEPREWNFDGDKAAYEAALEAFKPKLAEFGRPYLNQIMSQEEAEAYAARNLDWDMEAGEMLAWIKSHREAEPDAVTEVRTGALLP